MIRCALVAVITFAASSHVSGMALNPNGPTVIADQIRSAGAVVGQTLVGGKPAAVISHTLPHILGGREVAVVARNVITASNAAKALKAGARIALPVAVAVALNEAACESGTGGIMCDPLGDQVPTITWEHPAYPANTVVKGLQSPHAAAMAWIRWYALQSGWTLGTVSASCSGAACNVKFQFKNRPTDQAFNNGETEIVFLSRDALGCLEGSTPIGDKCTTGQRQPITDDQVSTRLVPAVGQDVAGTIRPMIEEGRDLRPYAEPQSLTGPAKTTGQPVTTRVTKPDGTVETTTTTPIYNHTYSTINNTTVVNTTVTNKTEKGDGTVTEEDKPQDDTPAAVDPDMPEVPDLYEQQYPEGVQGVWERRQAEIKTSGLFALAASMVPNIGIGGCPAWSLPVMVGINRVQTIDASLPCWLWDALAAIMMVSALIAARRIVFGG